MATKRTALGKGVGALLSGGLEDVLASTKARAKEELRDLPVDLLQRGRYQPRTHMEQSALEDLAKSIKVQGIIQPIVVRALSKDKYEIIAGERRWRAAQLAGLDKVPAVIRNIPDEAAIAVALIENIQRENLNPIEEAMALQRLATEFKLTHEQAAESVGRSRAAVTNLLRLLSLNPNVRELLEDGTLDMGHGRALLALQGNTQSQAAKEVVKKGLSVRETEQLVRRLLDKKPAKKKNAGVDADTRALQEQLSDKLGAKVKLQHSAKGAGKLIIEYNSNDELEGILSHFR
ncbi:MAG: chromosome partitioning protein ParB [Acidithiobacillales bacterium SG8_45]|jgi:ParB family chromosome partitioning protein|nr:MAG: chromosome partitioning protein ParB [Acidithiobacillales bacterium SG8_45]